MVVEDNPQVLVLAESMLQEAGHEVITATNYDGAIALLEQGNQPELALIDHNLGEGLSGIDVAKAVRLYLKKIAVIYTSGDHVSDGTRALFVEGCEFLPKPYTPDELKKPSADCWTARAPRLPVTKANSPEPSSASATSSSSPASVLREPVRVDRDRMALDRIVCPRGEISPATL